MPKEHKKKKLPDYSPTNFLSPDLTPWNQPPASVCHEISQKTFRPLTRPTETHTEWISCASLQASSVPSSLLTMVPCGTEQGTKRNRIDSFHSINYEHVQGFEIRESEKMSKLKKRRERGA